MKSLKEVLEEKIDKGFGPKYVSEEFQDYGYRLAQSLGDLKHKAFYIKLAKEKPRILLDRARDFAIGYDNARDKARIFMWKLKKLVNGSK